MLGDVNPPDSTPWFSRFTAGGGPPVILCGARYRVRVSFRQVSTQLLVHFLQGLVYILLGMHFQVIFVTYLLTNKTYYI